LQGGANVDVSVGDKVYTLEGEDITLQTESAAGMEAATDGFVTIGLVTELTPELLREGLAREILNRLQTQRKESGLEVQDRIEVVLSGDTEVQAAIAEHGAWIAVEVLAPNGLRWVDRPSVETALEFRSWELPNEQQASIAIAKIVWETA